MLRLSGTAETTELTGAALPQRLCGTHLSENRFPFVRREDRAQRANTPPWLWTLDRHNPSCSRESRVV